MNPLARVPSIWTIHTVYMHNFKLYTDWGGSVAEWLACWTLAQKGLGHKSRSNCSHPLCLCSPSRTSQVLSTSADDGNLFIALSVQLRRTKLTTCCDDRPAVVKLSTEVPVSYWRCRISLKHCVGYRSKKLPRQPTKPAGLF